MLTGSCMMLRTLQILGIREKQNRNTCTSLSRSLNRIVIEHEGW